MLSQHQKLSTLFIGIFVGILLMVNESDAVPTAKLIVNPQQIEVPVGSGPMALTVQATGSNLEYEWQLKGPGKLEGDTTDSAVLYRPPKEIEGESESVIIKVTVKDDQGQEAIDSIIFSIVATSSIRETTPTPTPTPPSNGKLVHDFDLKEKSWESHIEGGAKANFQFSKSNISVLVSHSTGAFFHIQILRYGVKLIENRRYALRLRVSANKECELIFKFHKPSPNWDSYQNPEEPTLELSSGDNTVESIFTAKKSTSNARFTLYLGQLEPGTEITIHKIQLYDITNTIDTIEPEKKAHTL